MLSRKIVVKNRRKNLRFFGLGAGVGGGGGTEAVEEGGGGGVKGIGWVVFPGVVVAGVAGVGATCPGGSGSDVLVLADPGSTADFESAILGFFSSAYPLRLPEPTRPAGIACH